MISIYLFKNNQFIFLISFVFNFQESYLHLILLKEFIKNNIYKKKKKLFYLQRNDFYLPLLGKKNEFLQFYLQRISSLILI